MKAKMTKQGEIKQEIVAYKAWKCKFCEQVSMDSHDMWRHLIDKHGKHSVENNGEVMWTHGD